MQQQPNQQNGQPYQPPQSTQPYNQPYSSPQNTPQPYNQQNPPPQGTPQPYQHQPSQSTQQQYQYRFTPDQMRRYFNKPSWSNLWGLLIIGAILLVFLFIFVFTIPLGIVLMIVGLIRVLRYYIGLPTDDEYAKWVSERSQPLYSKALQRLHLDESQFESKAEIQGGISSLLQLTKKFPEKEIAVKRLPNGNRHYSINVCIYIFLTKDSLAIYSGYINAFAQIERFEDADHYYYSDVVGVSTSGPIYTFWNGSDEKEVQLQGFFVRVNNGESVGTDYATRVILRNQGDGTQFEGVDNVVAELLALLRDHKMTSIEANRISKDIL